jgi:hypothetical protein
MKPPRGAALADLNAAFPLLFVLAGRWEESSLASTDERFHCAAMLMGSIAHIASTPKSGATRARI